MAADFYQLFGLQQDADITSVKRSYRRLAKEYHPDKNVDDPFAKELFQKINEAYDVLSDPVKRVGYDSYLKEKKRRQEQKSFAKQSIFDTIMNFGQEDTLEETDVRETKIQNPQPNFQAASFHVSAQSTNQAAKQPQINNSVSANKIKNPYFKLSSLPSAHYISLFLMAAMIMLIPTQEARAGLALVWLFYVTHALLSSWWIYKVRNKLPKERMALGGLILMTHVLSASLSMLFLLPFTLVIYYMR